MTFVAIKHPIGGRNYADPLDLNNTRNVFHDFGLYEGDETGPMVDASLDKAIKAFQELHGLKIDGIINPGGETENEIAKIKTGKLSPRYVQNLAQENDTRDNRIGFGGNPLGVLPTQKPKATDELPVPSRKLETDVTKRNLFEMALPERKIEHSNRQNNVISSPPKKPIHYKNKDVDLENRLLHLIGTVESNNDYNIMVGGKKEPLTKMTISEVRELQAELDKKGENTAAGRFQIKGETMDYLINRMNLDGNQKFNADTQNQMAKVLLKKRGLEAFKRGEYSSDEFISFLAKEWASLPKDVTNKSYYQGVGGNKALIEFDIIKEALQD